MDRGSRGTRCAGGSEVPSGRARMTFPNFGRSALNFDEEFSSRHRHTMILRGKSLMKNLVAGSCALIVFLAACHPRPASIAGTWRAALASPGGELPFTLRIDQNSAVIVNGSEHVPVSG